MIGTGAFGKVRLAVHKLTEQTVAIKCLEKSAYSKSPELTVNVLREIMVLKLVRHPSVCCLLEVIDTNNHIFLAIEHLPGGDLYDYIVSRGNASEAHGRHIWRQIASAVQYCHAHGIVHRDLKAENIVLTKMALQSSSTLDSAIWSTTLICSKHFADRQHMPHQK